MALRKDHPLSSVRDPDIHLGPAKVARQVRYAPHGWKMVVRIPWRGRIDAGQFVHVQCEDEKTFPLLRRPFSVWDARPVKGGTEVDLVYAVVGTGTAALEAKKPGETVGYMGPLGRGYTRRKAKTYLFVAGGVGIVPFYLFAKQAPGPKKVLLFGARNKSMLYGIDDFQELGVEVHAATDDGSRGHRGFVTELLDAWLKSRRRDVAVYVCGPEPMLEAAMEIARRRRVACEVSMEKRMGCALGACGACVTTVRDGGDWRYSRICIEGPCYDAEELVAGRV